MWNTKKRSRISAVEKQSTKKPFADDTRKEDKSTSSLNVIYFFYNFKKRVYSTHVSNKRSFDLFRAQVIQKHD